MRDIRAPLRHEPFLDVIPASRKTFVACVFIFLKPAEFRGEHNAVDAPEIIFMERHQYFLPVLFRNFDKREGQGAYALKMDGIHIDVVKDRIEDILDRRVSQPVIIKPPAAIGDFVYFIIVITPQLETAHLREEDMHRTPFFDKNPQDVQQMIFYAARIPVRFLIYYIQYFQRVLPIMRAAG